MAFSMQALLHPGVAAAGVLFLSMVFLYNSKILVTSLINNSILDIRSFLIILTCTLVGFFIYINSSSLSLPYSSWLEIVKVDTLIWRTSIMAAGVAAYPSWLIADTPMQFLLLLIPKSLYFLFSPFPWDISKFKHFIGMLDGVVYMLLFLSIYSHRKYIKSNNQAILLLVFIIFLCLIFSIAVGNFGTGIRHRSKILPIIIVLAAPFIYRALFSRRKK